MDSPEYKKLLDDTKAYFNARYDLLKLELLEKLSCIIGLVILAVVVVLLVFGAFAFFGMALIFLLSKVLPLTASCCILGAGYTTVVEDFVRRIGNGCSSAGKNRGGEAR